MNFLYNAYLIIVYLQALENRTKESKQEMDILEKLEELRDLNARHASGISLL